MSEPKPFASLTGTLLARKGAASPAMRRQINFGAPSQDDLGWNDMGEEVQHQSDPSSVAGLTPMPQPAPVQAEQAPPVPPVVEQQRVLERAVSAALPAKAPAKPVAAARPRKAKAAFTLRLDPERHLRLRLACAVGNRSAQQIVTEALDSFLNSQPELDALAGKVSLGDAETN